MLTRIDPLCSIFRQICYARCYHRPVLPKKPAKDAFEEKRKSMKIGHSIKEHAEKLKDLHHAMERIERRQKKLLTEMDEVDKILQDLLQKDKKAEVNEDNIAKKRT